MVEVVYHSRLMPSFNSYWLISTWSDVFLFCSLTKQGISSKSSNWEWFTLSHLFHNHQGMSHQKLILHQKNHHCNTVLRMILRLLSSKMLFLSLSNLYSLGNYVISWCKIFTSSCSIQNPFCALSFKILSLVSISTFAIPHWCTTTNGSMITWKYLGDSINPKAIL